MAYSTQPKPFKPLPFPRIWFLAMIYFILSSYYILFTNLDSISNSILSSTHHTNISVMMTTQEQHSIQNTAYQQDTIDCASQPPYNKIILKGERHSGTNWVTRLPEQNGKSIMEFDQSSLDIGWKHGFLPPQGWGRPLEQIDLLVIVTRDVFTWLPKMYHEPYDPEINEHRKEKFYKFIMRSYVARCLPL